MNILVCVKPVPDPDKYELLRIDPATKRLVREGIPTIVNPADRSALEAALRLRALLGGKVTVLSMAPEFSRDRVMECLAMGADEAYMVSDRAYGGADTLATSYTLMGAVARLGEKPDLILAGNESADGATAHVPVQLAEWLGLPHLTNVYDIEGLEDRVFAWKKTGKGAVRYEVALPALLSVNREAYQPRLITAMGVVKARSKKIEILTQEDLRLDPGMIGEAGSPTKAGELIVPDLGRASTELTGGTGEIADKIIALIGKVYSNV